MIKIIIQNILNLTNAKFLVSFIKQDTMGKQQQSNMNNSYGSRESQWEYQPIGLA